MSGDAPVAVLRSPGDAGGARRIRFVSAPPEPRLVVRTYDQPRTVWAIETTEGDRPGSGDSMAGAESGDIVVTLLPPQREGKERRAPSAEAEEGVLWTARRENAAVQWRPGKAVVLSEVAARPAIVAAVIDFAFLEGELRSLETFVQKAEPRAEADLPAAHRLARSDRSRWAEMARLHEEVTGARLKFARLEPQFLSGSRSLSPEGRSWFSRLCRRGRVEDRLEAASDRLEALEDFYEAANQRISDYRWYREGHLLETGIIGILVVECLLMLGDIFVHLSR